MHARAPTAPDASWMNAQGRRGNAREPPASRTPIPPAVATSLTSFNSGMMFGCKRDTYDENMSRHLFGLPESHWDTAKQITDQTLVRAPPWEGTHESTRRSLF